MKRMYDTLIYGRKARILYEILLILCPVLQKNSPFLQILQKPRMIYESYLHSIGKMTKFDFLLFSNLSESSENIDINDIYQGSYRIEWYKAPSHGAGHLTMLSRPTNVFFWQSNEWVAEKLHRSMR